MRVLITAGPTHEPIDPVRYIGNRSSGRMGAALAETALRQRHQVTLILGPVSVAIPRNVNRVDVETSSQMQEAVMRVFPRHDLLIMAAAKRHVRFMMIQDTYDRWFMKPFARALGIIPISPEQKPRENSS